MSEFVNKRSIFIYKFKNSLQFLLFYIIIAVRYAERMFINMKKTIAVILGLMLVLLSVTGCASSLLPVELTGNKFVYFAMR